MATLDTLQAEVNTLTTATTSILSEVQTKKAVLDAAAADAVAASGTAATSAANALASKDSAAISATLAANTATALTGFDLAAIAASKAVTAVDVFVYDTSKDSDGGAWRKRTQGTSWYNETLNTATRGSRREFPAVAVIVAEDDTVTIYDGDDPSLPMWMVFTSSNPSLVQPDVTATTALDGILCVSTAGRGLSRIEFNLDDGVLCFNDGFYTARTNGMNGIAERNTSFSWTQENGATRLINNTVNDVAMTVLPDAPIDAATGLPVPTIAVATDGGVSVIRDDGAVVDITHSASNFASGVDFRADGAIVYGVDGLSTRMRFVHVDHQIPTSDVSKGSGLYGTDSDEFYPQSSSKWTNTSLRLLPDNFSGAKPLISNKVVSSNLGVNFLSTVPSAPTTGMVAYTTSTYNTGWMNGDIKGAFLSDTDDTDLVGAGELVTNGTFDTVTTGWTAIANTTLTIDTGRLKVTSDANALGGAYQTITTVVGQRYLLTFTGLESTSTSSNGRVYVGTSLGGTQLGIAYAVGDNEITFEFTATTTTTYLQLNQNTATAGLYMLFDDVSVVAADADRSVNANPLEINGTITRTPVATGADLVAYSGFSSSNYLEQPYNSDLDFGTGDFCVMGWGKTNINGTFLSRGDGVSAGSWFWRHLNGSTSPFYIHDGSAFRVAINVALPQGNMVHFALLRQSGTLFLYGNGELMGSLSGTYPALSMTNLTAKLRIGEQQHSSYSGAGEKQALLRISATAPSAEQIAKIYNDEKVLFQENAQATLYGTSDSVTALAHDSDTDLLHVGTSAGRSVFQGLRRVSNTTTAVGTAISASNGLVVEE